MSDSGEFGMHDLLREVSRLTGTHLSELSADLAQTNDLLAAAIVRLMAEFDGLNQALRAQQVLLQQAPPSNAAQWLDLQRQAERHVQGMVTGMQFEDMTKQLLSRSQARVAGLAGMLKAVDEAGRQTACGQLQEQLRNNSSALFGALQTSVPQQRMEGGDVELF
jgi:hypothetical protein